MNGMVLVVYVSVRERGRERTNNERNTWSIVSERERGYSECSSAPNGRRFRRGLTRIDEVWDRIGVGERCNGRMLIKEEFKELVEEI